MPGKSNLIPRFGQLTELSLSRKRSAFGRRQSDALCRVPPTGRLTDPRGVCENLPVPNAGGRPPPVPNAGSRLPPADQCRAERRQPTADHRRCRHSAAACAEFPAADRFRGSDISDHTGPMLSGMTPNVVWYDRLVDTAETRCGCEFVTPVVRGATSTVTVNHQGACGAAVLALNVRRMVLRAPCGSWPSPISPRCRSPPRACPLRRKQREASSGGSESRPTEGGRTQLVRRVRNGATHELLPATPASGCTSHRRTPGRVSAATGNGHHPGNCSW